MNDEGGGDVCEWQPTCAAVCGSELKTLFCLIMSVWPVMKFDYACKGSSIEQGERDGRVGASGGGGGGEILISSEIMHETPVCNFPSLLVHHQIVSSSSLAWNFCISICLSVRAAV